MGFHVDDGTGKGYSVKVDSNNEMLVKSNSASLQHVVSERDGEAYQVVGDFASVNNATHTILHIQNTSATKNLTVTYIRLQTVDLAGGTAPPTANCYWQIGKGTTYSSGGTAVTPSNVNLASGNTASATCYDNNATVAGTFVELDRYYPQSEADSVTYNKEGSIVLGKDDTLEIRLTADNTSGTAYARVSFFYEVPTSA
jgi:hypothetical protein